MGIAKTTFFLFPLHLLIWVEKKQHTAEEKWQGKGRQAVLVTSIPAFNIILSVCFLAVFLDYSAAGKYQPCARDLSSKSFYIKKVKDLELVGTSVTPVSITQN